MNNDNLNSSEKLVLSLSSVFKDVDVGELFPQRDKLDKRKELIFDKRKASCVPKEDKKQ